MKKFGVLQLALVTFMAALAFSSGVGIAKAEISGAKCGGGLTASITPSLPGTYDFTAVCVQHDKCYANLGISRGSCDQAFILNMLAECKRQPKATQSECEHVASEYHSAVASNGEAAYERAQKEARVTVFNGSYLCLAIETLSFTLPPGTTTPPPPPKTLRAPIHVTVINGVVQGGHPLAVGGSDLSPTATSTESVPVAGFGQIVINLHFSYFANGPATVKGYINSKLVSGGVAVSIKGTLSGTHSIGG